ncbi:acyl-CoA carboxylase subunit epsilon [Actinospica durhamensis]|uniref:Acyl-CoA carboxylase subunit epsilon n=1 Tax=Actinospica durhamensis TaxID=1508375 RepID=A0A941IN63_9ACTN|nr:acyl-CoA carboxylase subunit epsilon [Actinospica durhamensis]MBR7835050.1 acyl-CoA carboxylase subunit epsilon [Actinospica durhamensis]
MSAEVTGDAGVAGVSALRVVAGQPTDEELAALIVVLAARSGSGAGAGVDDAETSSPVSAWTDRARYVRAGRWGFGAYTGWRASALPR